MHETGRRSATSTSELGLYSDRGERYTRGKYGPVVRKFVTVVMAVVAVVLAAIFVYDFASGASATSKVSQETKRIYVLQNALKRTGGSLPKRESSDGRIATKRNETGTRGESFSHGEMQDRSDNADPRDLEWLASAPVETEEALTETGSPVFEGSFNERERLVENPTRAMGEEVEGKRLLENHAVVYRVRQTRYKYPDPEEEFEAQEIGGNENAVAASRPLPFRFELKTPQPASFDKRPKFPQLTQYRYPHASRNIQDIIEYLTNDPGATKRGIKFTGVYVKPKKYEPEIGETMANSERNEYSADGVRYIADYYEDDGYGHGEDEEAAEDEEEDDDDLPQSSRYATVGNGNGDPFYRYKPKHPTDVNLLAPSNVRFSPSGTQRYNPYHDPFFQRPALNYARPAPPPLEVPRYVENAAGYAANGNYGKRRKPKPFSVMLDIYPITDLNEQAPSNKVSRPRLPAAPPPSLGIDDYDPRRPVAYTRAQGHRYPSPNPPRSIPLVAVPAAHAGLADDDERQQMIFHLNLYPRKKSKRNRSDIIQRSASMRPEEHDKFMHSVASPFDAITKLIADHSAIQDSNKYEESELPETGATSLEENDAFSSNEETSENRPRLVENVEEVESTTMTSTPPQEVHPVSEKFNNSVINVDTPEGFQAFADGLLAAE